MSDQLTPWLNPWRVSGNAIHLLREGISLARRVIEELIDDVDGQQASETVRFSYRGTDYEIDLSEKNAAKLSEALAPYVAVARKENGSRSTRATTQPSTRRPDPSNVREWARNKGLKVSDRGRVPADITRQYEEAHGH